MRDARRARLQARPRRPARAGARRRRRRPASDGGRHRHRRRGAVGRPAVRLARLQARQLERDRAREGPADDRHRRRPDEPRRRGADRDREGRRSSATTRPGAVLASDAFFPFADGPQLALDAGVAALIQPGGSKRDDEVDRSGRRRRARRWSSPGAALPALDAASVIGPSRDEVVRPRRRARCCGTRAFDSEAIRLALHGAASGDGARARCDERPSGPPMIVAEARQVRAELDEIAAALERALPSRRARVRAGDRASVATLTHAASSALNDGPYPPVLPSGV